MAKGWITDLRLPIGFDDREHFKEFLSSRYSLKELRKSLAKVEENLEILQWRKELVEEIISEKEAE